LNKSRNNVKANQKQHTETTGLSKKHDNSKKSVEKQNISVEIPLENQRK